MSVVPDRVMLARVAGKGTARVWSELRSPAPEDRSKAKPPSVFSLVAVRADGDRPRCIGPVGAVNYAGRSEHPTRRKAVGKLYRPGNDLDAVQYGPRCGRCSLEVVADRILK